MRAFEVIIDRYVVIVFISKEQWPPSGKKEDKEIRTPRGLPGLNLAQVCILFFSPTSRQLNLSANRKTKENVFSEAHGNSSPQAPETLKCFHSVLSGVLYQSQFMGNTVISSRGHMSASTSLPFLGAIEQEPHKKCYIPKSGGSFWVTRVSSFSYLSFLALAFVLGIPPLVSLLLISHHGGRICFPHSTLWFWGLCKYLLSNYCMVSTKIYSVEEENSKICSFF